MIGLANSRRGMKSPPFLVAALVACIIVLGFNYWIASSRGVDLQNRIMELEGRVRRGVAERGAVELKKNEFQGELKKQREQIDEIQSLHDFQIENMNKMHRNEKELLLNNITIDNQLIQNLQEHLKKMQKQYEKLQLDVYRFQKNYTNLQRKFTFDMSQCISKVKELTEQCEEKIEVSPQDSKIQEEEKEDISHISGKKYLANPQILTLGQAELQNHHLTNQENEPQEKNTSNDSMKLESSKQTAVIKNMEELDYHKEKGTSDITNEERRKEELAINQDHPETPSMLSRDHKAMPPKPDTEQNQDQEIRNVLGEVSAESLTGRFLPPLGHQTMNEGKANDEEIEREELLNDDLQQPDDQEPNQNGEFQLKKLSQDNKGEDYNLDANEAESETDKQAALVDHQNNFNDQNLEDPKMERHLFKLDEVHNQKL